MTTVAPRTLIEMARREAAAPLIEGMTHAEVEQLGARWEKELRPHLLEAAQEKRKLRALDLAALDRTADGKGVTLDDVLDFLLSPAGCHLQSVLEQAVRPDHPILPLGDLDDDAPDPPPWSAPPKDSFEARLRESRENDPLGLAPQRLLLAAVAAFADATGKDGRVDEAAVQQQGPLASALYTFIAEKTAGKAQHNPVPGQKLVGLDDAAVARVGRGIDPAPIRARMQGFDAVVEQLLQGQQPFQGMKVVAIQHLLPTLSGVLDALAAGGVDKADMRLIGKSYSTVDEMYAWLVGQGYDVHPGSIGGDAASVEARLVEAAKDTLGELFAGVTPPAGAAPGSVKPQFLLADDGGKLIYALHKYYPEYAPLCAAFEQTARGIQVLKKMEEDGIPIRCPVVNMAGCELKNDSEIPLIGENIVFDSLQYLDELKLPNPQTATVLGFGPVGEQVARALLRRGKEVFVYDPDPQKQALARQLSCTVTTRNDALGRGELVVGCTGRGALDVVDDHHLLRSGAVLVNGASGNHELGTEAFGRPGKWFMEVAFEPDKLTVKNGAASCLFGGKRIALGSGRLGSASMHRVMKARDTGKEVLILRSGHVVNLGRDLPPEFIQVTRALVFASILQSVLSRGAGIFDVQQKTQDLIRNEMEKDLAARDLSFARPDFSGLQPWGL